MDLPLYQTGEDGQGNEFGRGFESRLLNIFHYC